MSDSFLRLIPEDPQFEPSRAAAEAATQALRALLPSAAEVNAHRFQDIRFFDQGSNFERILCPHCKHEITSYWSGWMDERSRSGFTQRMVVMPCCHRASDLNDLTYVSPAGFAKFVLEITNPDLLGWLPDPAQKSLESILGCGVRQILAHY
jgi:hypothetical protein